MSILKHELICPIFNAKNRAAVVWFLNHGRSVLCYWLMPDCPPCAPPCLSFSGFKILSSTTDLISRSLKSTSYSFNRSLYASVNNFGFFCTFWSTNFSFRLCFSLLKSVGLSALIIWYPKLDLTTSDTSPSLSLNSAFSKSLSVCPLRT